MTLTGLDVQLTLSGALLVVHTTDGFTVPLERQDGWHRPVDGDGHLRLEPADLALLLGLAQPGRSVHDAVTDVAERLEVTEARLTRTVEIIRAAGLLVARPGTVAPGPREGRPDPTTRPTATATATDPDHARITLTPETFAVRPEGFLFTPEGADPALLGLDELLLAGRFRAAAVPSEICTDAELVTLARLEAIGLVQRHDDTAVGDQGAGERRRRIETARFHKLVDAVNRIDRERRDLRRPRDERPTGLVSVLPVCQPLNKMNLALGLIFSYCRAHDGGRLNDLYDLQPYWLVRRSTLKRLLDRRGPSVFLFSNYAWSHQENMELSAMVKALSPDSITIHGGPNTPKYETDTERFLLEHRHVDVSCRLEGEITTAEILTALNGELAGRNGDLSVLAGVQGIAFRDGDRVVRTPDRDRNADLDLIPSPYLNGVFDAFGEATAPFMTIESNRGCPYGCAFCDWGSATLSRIRKFDLDRIFAEIEWAGEHQFPEIWVADANFGIMARDIDIAEKVADVRRRTGFPRAFRTSYAKNTTKHIDKIVEILVDAGVSSEGTLSLQTTDAPTLKVINRSNIKVEAYDDLAATFRRQKLPLYTDLMFGLPGSTKESFAQDLQTCVDREINARVHPTQLLVNSPMNDPAYREAHQIVTERVYEPTDNSAMDLVVATATFTRDDHATMHRWRSLFIVAENFGILRHISRWVRHETGQPEMQFYAALDTRTQDDPEAYPLLTWSLTHSIHYGIAPLGWSPFYAEVATYLERELGLAPSSASRTVLAVQQALMPTRGRPFPVTIELEHDYAEWFGAVLRAKDAGERWYDVVPQLHTFGPGTFTVDDPTDVSHKATGTFLDVDFLSNWELVSPVARPLPPRHTIV